METISSIRRGDEAMATEEGEEGTEGEEEEHTPERQSTGTVARVHVRDGRPHQWPHIPTQHHKDHLTMLST